MDARLHPTLNPLWWRVPTWILLTIFTVAQANGVAARVVTGIAMGLSAIALQLVSLENDRVARAAVLASIVLALVAIYTSPLGTAEVLVVVATTRAPQSIHGVALRWFVVLDAVAFAVTMALALGSLTALLTGLAVPFFVQRALDQQELVHERDRAQALLVEVQRGRESEAQAAALQERGRIAREMHDVLAHSLAGLSVQLQAIRAVAARENAGPAVVEPLDRAATLAREGLAEARAAVSTLRDPVGLGLDALPALIDRHPGAARLRIDGDPGEVGAETGHAVYRAVQESLTNAARYAPGSPVDIVASWARDALRVTVTDEGPAPGRDSVGGQGTGLGLAGMGERIAQVSGTLSSGPGPDGRGWRVELCVPTSGARAGGGVVGRVRQ